MTGNVEIKYEIRIIELEKTNWRGNSNNCLKPKVLKNPSKLKSLKRQIETESKCLLHISCSGEGNIFNGQTVLEKERNH